jgi:putative tricarboxylic transport membrane protein
MVFSAIGVYSLNSSAFEIYLTAGFGIVGFVLMKLDFPLPPMLLGFVLGPMMEENLRRSLLLGRGDPTVLLRRPISLGFLIATLLILLIVALPAFQRRRPEIAG